MASGILVLNISMRAGVGRTEVSLTIDMDHPTNVCLIMAWEMDGPYLFTALLKVSYQLISS